MEIIFGTYATDDLKLFHHRTAQSGIQHAQRLEPLDPTPGQPVTVTVHTGPDLNTQHIACYYTNDGSTPEGTRGVAQHGETVSFRAVEVFWDTLSWGYVTRWQCTLPPQPESTIVRYRISAWADDAGEIFADWPHVKTLTDRAAAAFFDGHAPPNINGVPSAGQLFTYHVDRLRPPDWAYEAIIYQIFIDRFYPGDGREWLQSDDLGGFFGGTLWGVIDKLDYSADLGISCIWLTPTFASPTAHGYDVTDYYHVEPRLGGDEALQKLVEAAHARNIRIILDLPCNHVSHQHPIFQAARDDPESPYRDWFTFDESPVGYRSFFNVPQMPEINVANPDARQWLIEIGRYWIREFDVDGYRLDHANGPGPDFWPDFWAACKAEKPDCFCFGEIIDAPDHQRAYIGRLDGCLDPHMAAVLRSTYARGDWSLASLDNFIRRHQQFFDNNFILPTFLDNHDMDRFLFVAGGDKEALKRAAVMQMNLPQPPIIYYGTEVGLSQTASASDGLGLEASRLPMLWGGEQDTELLDFYRQLIRTRRASTG